MPEAMDVLFSKSIRLAVMVLSIAQGRIEREA
jgi:hypothetical protein